MQGSGGNARDSMESRSRSLRKRGGGGILQQEIASLHTTIEHLQRINKKQRRYLDKKKGKVMKDVLAVIQEIDNQKDKYKELKDLVALSRAKGKRSGSSRVNSIEKARKASGGRGDS